METFGLNHNPNQGSMWGALWQQNKDRTWTRVFCQATRDALNIYEGSDVRVYCKSNLKKSTIHLPCHLITSLAAVAANIPIYIRGIIHIRFCRQPTKSNQSLWSMQCWGKSHSLASFLVVDLATPLDLCLRIQHRVLEKDHRGPSRM